MIALALTLLSAAPTTQPNERRLHPHTVEASSFLWNSWNKFQENYHPNYAFDDDRKTAWTEGEKGHGKGTWMRAHISRLRGAKSFRLRIRNGYQKRKGLFRANASVKTMEVVLLPGKHRQTITVKDTMGWQDVVVSNPGGEVSAIEFRMKDVRKGKKYADLCVSDVQIFATATDRENPKAEKEYFEAIVSWKKERLAAAEFFKTQAAKEFPLASGYKLVADEPTPKGKKRNEMIFASLPSEVLKVVQDGAGFSAVDVAMQRKEKVPPINGIEVFRPVTWDDLNDWDTSHCEEKCISECEGKSPEDDDAFGDCVEKCEDGCDEDSLAKDSEDAARRHLLANRIYVPDPAKIAMFDASWFSAFAAEESASPERLIKTVDYSEPDEDTDPNAIEKTCRKTYAYEAKFQTGQGGQQKVVALRMHRCYDVPSREYSDADVRAMTAFYDGQQRLAALKVGGSWTLYEWGKGPGGAPMVAKATTFFKGRKLSYEAETALVAAGP